MLAAVLPVLAVILILVAVLIISKDLPWNKSVSRYWERPCAGRVWRRTFPDAPTRDIRRFIHCFACHAFMFPERIALHFRPDDRIMDVYRAMYPLRSWFSADSMEIEFFASYVKEDFGLSASDLETAWHENITLGDVFLLTRQA